MYKGLNLFKGFFKLRPGEKGKADNIEIIKMRNIFGGKNNGC